MRCLTGVLMAARVKLPTRTLTDETGTACAPGSQPHTGQLGGRSQKDEAKRPESHQEGRMPNARQYRRGSRARCGAWNWEKGGLRRLHRWTMAGTCQHCGRTRAEVARVGRETDKQRTALARRGEVAT